MCIWMYSYIIHNNRQECTLESEDVVCCRSVYNHIMIGPPSTYTDSNSSVHGASRFDAAAVSTLVTSAMVQGVDRPKFKSAFGTDLRLGQICV